MSLDLVPIIVTVGAAVIPAFWLVLSAEWRWRKRRKDERRMCVCLHPKVAHSRKLGVLGCNAPGCACGRGCIHDGFVCSDGSTSSDEWPDENVAARRGSR